MLAFYHFGIEQSFFDESFICNVENQSKILSKEQLLKELNKNIVSCKDVTFRIFEIYGYKNVNVLKEMFSTKGGMFSWFGILFTAGFTPLPFKIFTITSGFIHFNIIFFIFTCTLARGLRFFFEAFLVNKFGIAIGSFLEKKAGKWSLIIAGIIVLLSAGVYSLLINK